MPLVVNHAMVERLANELAEATGEPVSEALLRALEDRLRRVRGRRYGPRRPLPRIVPRGD